MMDTPSLIINTAILEKNLKRMAEAIKQAGVALRPHIKTHKMPVIAKQQIVAGAQGITTATISEAEVMAQHGITDIFVAYPIVTESKLERVVNLSKQISLMIGVDSLAGAENVAKVAKQHQQSIQVRLEVDTGFRRTGVPYETAVELTAQIHAMEYVDFKGIYTYRGFFMDGKPTTALKEAGLSEGQLMVSIAEQIRNKGIAVRDVSVGSTPTAIYAAQVQGVTEVRPGTYVFNDRMQSALQTCTLADCAAVVRVTVVSRPAVDLMIIDGGSKTFATDIALNSEPLNLSGFGQIVEAPHAIIERLSEEHGMVQIKESDPFAVGDVVHVIPNHICSTVNLHNEVYFDNGDRGMEAQRVHARGMLS